MWKNWNNKSTDKRSRRKPKAMCKFTANRSAFHLDLIFPCRNGFSFFEVCDCTSMFLLKGKQNQVKCVLDHFLCSALVRLKWSLVKSRLKCEDTNKRKTTTLPKKVPNSKKTYQNPKQQQLNYFYVHFILCMCKLSFGLNNSLWEQVAYFWIRHLTWIAILNSNFRKKRVDFVAGGWFLENFVRSNNMLNTLLFVCLTCAYLYTLKSFNVM